MTRTAQPRGQRRLDRRLNRRLDAAFPELAGNAVVATDRVAGFFDGMLAAIAAARSSVDVEMYLWDDDEVGRSFIEALRDSAARGLRVRVLVDAVGASSVLEPLAAVTQAGGDVRVFSPFNIRFLRRYFHRTHKKLLICDGARAFTGGAGFSRHWSSGARSEHPWHDRMFDVRGPVVAQLVRVFETDFYRWAGRCGPADAAGPADANPCVEEGTARLRVLRGWPDARDFRATLIEQVRASRERVWLGSPYFIPPPSLLRALTAALRRGVDVRLVLPCGNYLHPLLWHASRRHYGWFLRRGATIHEYAGAFYHAKLAVIDSTAAIFGSSNLDYWSWNRNAEIDVLATDEATAELVAACFESEASHMRVSICSSTSSGSL